MISSTVPKDEQKIQGYVPLYNVWVLENLVEAGHVGVNKNDAVSNIVLQWLSDNKKLIRECRLTTADYAKALKKKGGPQGIVPLRPPESSSEPPDEPVDRIRRAVVACLPLTGEHLPPVEKRVHFPRRST